MPEDFKINLIEKCIVRFAQQIEKFEQMIFDFWNKVERYEKDQVQKYKDLQRLYDEMAKFIEKEDVKK